MIGIATAWYISAEVSMFCVCSPIDGFWHRLSGAKCTLNFNLFSFLMGIFELVIDLCIILMPLRVLAKLNMPLRTKILVSGIFLLSGLYVKQLLSCGEEHELILIVGLSQTFSAYATNTSQILSSV